MSVTASFCPRCRIPDWRELRTALGVRQRDMARMLGITTRRYQGIEHSPTHVCPRDVSIERLRDHLALPEWRARLSETDYLWGWAKEDWK